MQFHRQQNEVNLRVKMNINHSSALLANVGNETNNNKDGEDVEEEEQDFAKMMKKNKKILTYRIKTMDKNCNHEVF